MQFMFLIGVNVYGWRSSGVNHVLIFELDPRNHLSEQHLMELAAILGVSWALSVLSFLYSSYISIPPYASPLVLLVLIVAFMLNPVKAFHYDARLWLVKLVVSTFFSFRRREIRKTNLHELTKFLFRWYFRVESLRPHFSAWDSRIFGSPISSTVWQPCSRTYITRFAFI